VSQVIHKPSVKGVLPCCKATTAKAAETEGTRTLIVSTVASLVTCGKKPKEA
jgi:hypothetical protein